MRAGMRTTGRTTLLAEIDGGGGLIRVAKAGAKRLSNARDGGAVLPNLFQRRRKQSPSMHSTEFNRVALTALGSILFAMLLVAFSNLIFSPHIPSKPGYALPTGTTEQAATAAAPAAPAGPPLPVLLAKADPKKGEQDVHVCMTCHNFEKGAGPKVGPPLWGVVGRPVASIAGFSYSDSLKKVGGDWTYDKLNEMIDNPKSVAPGTKMSFAGEKEATKRADILAYLQTRSEKPVPFPKETAAAPAPAAAPAEAKQAAATSAPAAPAETPLPVLLAKADVKKGEQDAHICTTCHNLEKGAGSKIGPPLWGVVGRQIASVEGFSYSDSLKSVHGDWTYDKLNEMITNPKSVAPGTKMTFLGEKGAQKRADILAYLQTLSDKPVPFPKESAAATPAASSDKSK